MLTLDWFFVVGASDLDDMKTNTVPREIKVASTEISKRGTISGFYYFAKAAEMFRNFC